MFVWLLGYLIISPRTFRRSLSSLCARTETVQFMAGNSQPEPGKCEARVVSCRSVNISSCRVASDAAQTTWAPAMYKLFIVGYSRCRYTDGICLSAEGWAPSNLKICQNFIFLLFFGWYLIKFLHQNIFVCWCSINNNTLLRVHYKF